MNMKYETDQIPEDLECLIEDAKILMRRLSRNNVSFLQAMEILQKREIYRALQGIEEGVEDIRYII